MGIDTDRPQTTHFINVDLDLRSEHGFVELFQAMKAGAMLINVREEELDDTHDFIVLETLPQPQTVDEAFALFDTIVAKFDDRTRAIWDSCSSRVLNIGIQSERHGHSQEFAISPQSIEIAKRMSASVAITVYSPVEEEEYGA